MREAWEVRRSARSTVVRMQLKMLAQPLQGTIIIRSKALSELHTETSSGGAARIDDVL